MISHIKVSSILCLDPYVFSATCILDWISQSCTLCFVLRQKWSSCWQWQTQPKALLYTDNHVSALNLGQKVIQITEKWRQLCFLSKIYVCGDLLYTVQTFVFIIISNYIEVHEEPVPRTKRFLHCVVKFEGWWRRIELHTKVYILISITKYAAQNN